MSDVLKCPKCSAELERGFIIDNTYGARGVSHWAPGSPKRSFWTGTKVPDEILPLGAFRCSGCGYVEFYADDRFAADL